MQTASVFARDDTFLGVCEALGEDFRFNPLFLRIALALTLLWNPLVALSAYAALGILVGLSRWIAPNPRSTAAAADAPVQAEDELHSEARSWEALAVAA